MIIQVLNKTEGLFHILTFAVEYKGRFYTFGLIVGF